MVTGRAHDDTDRRGGMLPAINGCHLVGLTVVSVAREAAAEATSLPKTPRSMSAAGRAAASGSLAALRARPSAVGRLEGSSASGPAGWRATLVWQAALSVSEAKVLLKQSAPSSHALELPPSRMATAAIASGSSRSTSMAATARRVGGDAPQPLLASERLTNTIFTPDPADAFAPPGGPFRSHAPGPRRCRRVGDNRPRRGGNV